MATGVWYYNPALISGILLGYVPLEVVHVLCPANHPGRLMVGTAGLRVDTDKKVSTLRAPRRAASLSVGLLWFSSAAGIPERMEARDIPFHHPVLGAASHIAPTDLWRRYPLAFPEAAGGGRPPDRCVSILGRLACHHRHHLGDFIPRSPWGSSSDGFRSRKASSSSLRSS